MADGGVRGRVARVGGVGAQVLDVHLWQPGDQQLELRGIKEVQTRRRRKDLVEAPQERINLRNQVDIFSS